MTFVKALPLLSTLTLIAGCATQSTNIKPIELDHSEAAQRAAQTTMLASRENPALKRKIAIGRFSNEGQANYSLLGNSGSDGLSRQLTDKLNSSLAQTGEFIVLQRTDLAKLKFESSRSNEELNLVGVDTLVFGSLTEYNRKTVGQNGFLSKSKKQVAQAKIELQLVDARTGRIYHAVTGAGEASSETSAVAGMGATAGYDVSLGDKAITNAMSDAVNKILTTLKSRKWSTGVLTTEEGLVYIAGGKRQGLRKGMLLIASEKGRKIISPQTGFNISLPAVAVAQLEVVDFFGEDEIDEGTICRVVDGTLNNMEISNIVVSKIE
jgi:curli biogenesis system outer membrane secretion channel CsgG